MVRFGRTLVLSADIMTLDQLLTDPSTAFLVLAVNAVMQVLKTALAPYFPETKQGQDLAKLGLTVLTLVVSVALSVAFAVTGTGEPKQDAMAGLVLGAFSVLGYNGAKNFLPEGWSGAPKGKVRLTTKKK
jgi:hypothetical protein